MLPGWDAPPGAISPDFHWTLGSCTQLPSNTFQMQRIRGYYRGLVPQASQFFDPPETDAQFQAAVGTMGLQSSPGQRLFTGASLVAAINSILGGAGLAVLAARVADLGDGAALAVGASVALVLFVWHLLYQQRRSAHVVLRR
jgi:hypothetical protein